MARYQKQRIHYPMGSVSSGTMRPEDLIPTFASELESLAKRPGIVSGKRRRDHLKLVREIDKHSHATNSTLHDDYLASEDSDWDLDALVDALGEYAGPYFYFGSHPGDGADYGFWLSEGWDEEFRTLDTIATQHGCAVDFGDKLKVADLAEIPAWFRGEAAVVNDHGNVTLYVKTCRTLRAIWSVV
jgi:hypothetical protein